MTAADGTASIADLLSALVRIPSRGGIDACAPVLGCIEAWCRARGLSTQRLVGDDGEPLGLYAEI